MNDSGVQEVYVYEGMRLVPETRLLLWAEKLAAAEERARRLEEALRAEALLLAAAAGIQAVAEEAGRTTKASEVYQYLAFRLALLAPPPEAACAHEWTTDGCHANVFCRKCYVSAPPEAEKRGEGA